MNTADIRKRLKKALPKRLYKGIYSAYKIAIFMAEFFVNKAEKKKFISESTIDGLNTDKRDFDITVSFTTFPARIEQAEYVADAMLRQTLKPDRVLLVLADSEFRSIEELPKGYINLQKRGLSIVFMENLMPHKKYFYAMQHYPDSLVITVDDDIFYPETLVETLYQSYCKNPKAVSALQAHFIRFENGHLMPYDDWKFRVTDVTSSSGSLFATGVGGVLYPPHSLHEDLLDADLIKKLCLKADDVWLKTMEVLSGTPVVLAAPNKQFRTVSIWGSQKVALYKDNCDNNRNDEYIENCMGYYGLTEETFAGFSQTKEQNSKKIEGYEDV